MCGIFGVINKNGNKFPAISLFKKLLIESGSRGKEASGFAIFNENENKIIVHKVPFSGTELIKSKFFNEFIGKIIDNEIFAGIGHSRLVTNGYEQYNYNNQPVTYNQFVVIHNGIVVNINELWQKYSFYKRKTDLDTEIIPVIINHYYAQTGNFEEAIETMFSEIEGVANIAILDTQNCSITIASNNGSLYYVNDNKQGLFFFGSEYNYITKIITDFNLNINATHINQLNNKSLFTISLSENIKNISIEEILFTGKQVYKNSSFEYNFKMLPETFQNYFETQHKKIQQLKRCSKCVLPETFPFIEFDYEGVCNYCRNYKPYPLKSIHELKEQIQVYHTKHPHKNSKVLIGLSGGRDSCYALHFVKKELGLDTIAFSYDWGMLTDLARRNQSRMCAKLGVEHILVSADIRKKRHYINLNVSAWLKKPHLGTIPLFMAGDKQYFYHSNCIMDAYDIDFTVFGENLLEATLFKYGFCGIKPNLEQKEKSFSISKINKIKMMLFYMKEYLSNPSYLNASLFDSFGAFLSFYYINHPYFNLFHYIKWDEKTIIDTLKNEYNWETDPETQSTWRIGDGTAAFYNYIYYIVSGFSENETFRSNQIREGQITREQALEKVTLENYPRWHSIYWYCNTIGIDFYNTIKRINEIPKLY